MGLFDIFKKKRLESNLKTFDLPYFGQVDLYELKEYYKVVINFKNNKISIDLNFKNKTIDYNNVENIKDFLLKIDSFDNSNKTYIKSDFNNKGETSDYINFYIDELDQEELSNIVDRSDISKEIQLFNKLRLVRVGLYPDGKYNSANFGVFDYSIDIDGEPCNQVLVINTNEKGTINNITWES